MLERGGVEDDLGTPLREDLPQRLTVPDIGQDDVSRVQKSVSGNTELGTLQPGLVAVEHDQLARAEPRDLSAQFGADRTAGTRDEHSLVGDVPRDRRHVRVNGMTSDEVFDGKIAHLDGLNLSRAWCWRAIAGSLPSEDPRRAMMLDVARRHLDASLPHVAGDYAGEHWLATFALLALM